MSKKVIEFISDIEFIANIDENKDCIMNQSTHQDAAETNIDNPNGLWFNIDVPKNHGLKQGEKIRIIIEKTD
ncbi:hypothetical protein L1994_05125 [Methanomicrobium antiquum]|uniref:Uncharacterized protein n=1 Tax=Methanomicrobium antiquum TaxID=487686 RepID=A0AAF0FTB2_9EURY|nr:hypothetical protein [Methanomicrobium antiquum]MDD3977244.1 hypothetical protein [Methanomicrobium sp.]WFN37771.1 hypothetical protein L1994_05125 [Methanomicrobium antiquum]